MDYVKKIFALLVICVFVYFVGGEIFLKMDVPNTGYRCEKYAGTWNRIKANGSRTPIKVPGKCKAKKNQLVTVETTLTAIDEHSVLCFRSAKQDIKIYVDGELRQQYSTKNTRLFGRASAVAYIFLEVSPQDTGKVLTLETRTDSSYSGIFYTVYYGNQMGIWHHFFKQYGTELIISFLTIILSVISILGSIALHICYRRGIELEYLGWGIFLAGMWLITNSIFRQLLFPNLSVVNDITFLTIMLLPLPFLIYMNQIQRKRYNKVYLILSAFVVTDFVIFSLLHMTNLKDFTDTIIYIVFVDVSVILAMGIIFAVDIIKGHIKEYYLVALGMLAAFIAAIVQCFMYFNRTTLFTGVILAIGLIFLLVFSIINTINNILHMEQEKQQALSASEAKGRFLANMSHEIRTPINAVLGMDAMIMRESSEPQIKEYALDIQNAGQSLLSLINDILDFSKIESGKLEILPMEYDFSSMIHDIINMISMKAELKGLTLDLYIDENLPSRLYGDDVRIRQVLVNLLNNAVKYTEQGSVSLSIEGSVAEESVLLHFTIEDTGIGIKEEDLAKLFTEFERIEEKRNRNIEGTGLGMNITKNLLELMGSSLQVESTYGSGSKFSFKLAQRIVDAEPIGDLEERIRNQATEYTYDANFTAPTAQILAVDDNPVNRRVFANLLKETKIHIDEAANGTDCLDMVRQKHYDMIFLDHMMPEMDGIETLHYLREWDECQTQDIPVIALTANAITGAREMYLSEGFNDFLSKPVNPEKLEKMLLDYLPEEKIIQQISTEKTQKIPEINFPMVDGIDWDYAMLHTKDVKILEDTIKDYYRLNDMEAEKLERLYHEFMEAQGSAAATEQLEQYRIKVHSMKSSAAMIGAVSLSGVARMLEYAARDGKTDIIKKLTPVFLEEWRNFKVTLTSLSPNKREDSKPEMDVQMLLQYLQLLDNAMADMDIDTADEIMNEIKRFSYPEQLQQILDRLDVAVVNMDTEAITGYNEEIRNQLSSEA